MSNQLRKLQEELQAYLLTGNPKITEAIVNPVQDEIDTRLAIYRDSYYLCLTNILRKDFPLLEKLLGEQAFEDLAMAYINQYPSKYFSIKDFGERLPSFLQTQTYSGRPHLKELAELTWELDNTMVTADAPLLTVNDLAAISQEKWGDLQLNLHPSVKLLTQHYNTFDIWQALQQDKPLPTVTELLKPIYCLLWRKELTPYCYVLNQKAACIITAFQAQQTFAEVCEQLTEFLPAEEVAQYVVNQLVNWLNQGIFSELQLKKN